MKMYAWALRQLSPLDKGIQAAHAVIECLNAGQVFAETKNLHDQWRDTHKTLVILSAPNLNSLFEIHELTDKISRGNSGCFFEPDIQQVTSVASLGIPAITGTLEWQYIMSKYGKLAT